MRKKPKTQKTTLIMYQVLQGGMHPDGQMIEPEIIVWRLVDGVYQWWFKAANEAEASVRLASQKLGIIQFEGWMEKEQRNG